MRETEAQWRLEIATKVELFYWALLVGYVAIVSWWPGFIAGWDTVIFGAVYTLYIPVFHRRFMPALLKYQPHLATIVDELMGLILISVIIFLTGAWTSPFFFLYFFPILFSALLHRGLGRVSPWWVVGTELILLTVMAFDTAVLTGILSNTLLAFINIGGLFLIAGIVTSVLYNLEENWRAKEEAEHAQRLAESAADKLRELSALKNDFIAVATHELSTPITIAKGRLSMALDEGKVKLSEKDRRYFDAVTASINRLGALVRDILTVSRLDAGLVRLVTGAYPLEHVVKTVLKKIPAEVRVRVVHEEPKHDLPKAQLDASKAAEVLEKVIENAVKFTAHHADGKRGTVTIRYGTSSEHVLVHIDDQGPGIAARDRRKIFERFSQIDRSRWEQQGSGLGLYIAKEIMKLTQGTVEVAEHKGGTRFTLSFPKADPVPHKVQGEG